MRERGLAKRGNIRIIERVVSVHSHVLISDGPALPIGLHTVIQSSVQEETAHVLAVREGQ